MNNAPPHHHFVLVVCSNHNLFAPPYYVVGADIAITLSSCIRIFGYVWVGMLARYNEKSAIGRNDLKLGTAVDHDSLSKTVDFGFIRLRRTGSASPQIFVLSPIPR